MKNLLGRNFMGIGIVLFLCLMSISCQSKRTNEDEQSLKFEKKQLIKEVCIGEECAKVSLEYPFFMGNSESADFLNVHVEQQLVMLMDTGESKEVLSLDSVVSTFLNSYIAFKKEFDSSQEWEITVNSKVAFQGSNLISIVFDSFSFTGGAHPNSYLMYLNFDCASNSILKNEELILDKNGLLALAERKFRTYHDVPDSLSLAEEGSFFLENEKDFFLPAAMGFEREDFVLFYNPYEIGPYVLGTTELKFSKEEINGLVSFPEIEKTVR